MAEEIRTSPSSEDTPMSPPVEHTPMSPPLEHTPMSPPLEHDPMSPQNANINPPMSPHNSGDKPTSHVGDAPMSSPEEHTPLEPHSANDNPLSPPAEDVPMSPQNDDDSPTSPPAEVNPLSPPPEVSAPSSPPAEVIRSSPPTEVNPSSLDQVDIDDSPTSPPMEDTQEEPCNVDDDSPTSPPMEDTQEEPHNVDDDSPSSPPAEYPPRSPPRYSSNAPLSPLPHIHHIHDTPPSSPFSHPHHINDTPPSSPPVEDTPMSPHNEDRLQSRSPSPVVATHGLSHSSPAPSSGDTSNLVIAQINDVPSAAAVAPNTDKNTDSVDSSDDIEMIDMEEDHEEVKVKVKADKKTSKTMDNGVVPEAKKDKDSNKAKTKAKEPPVEVEEIDLEDLEDGEIEDDEDDEKAIEAMEIKKNEIEEELNRRDKKDKVSPFSKIFGGGDKENHKKDKKEEKRSSSRKDKEKDKDSSNHSSSSHKDKDKDKESSKSRDKDRDSKEKDRKKKRRHSETADLLDEIEASKHISRDKRSRKSQENMELDGPMMAEDDDDYLFVRGGSPPPSGLTAKQMVLQNFAYAGNEHDLLDPAADGYGRMYEDDMSDEEGRRARRHRSPINIRRRRQDGRDDNGPRGGRRGGGGGGRVKDEVNKGQKSDVICAYYMQGKCQKTHEECVYSHNAVPPRKMELCKFWMMDCCAKREKCLYLHNDFPCKFYHTGLVCKQAERCKFSHKPLNEITKAVLLKHIETAPKEILGDFPRLNRNGALNLINKMESKILGALAEQERQKEKDNEPPRRTRWEQPTRDDQEKLQELMEEAGIGGYYRETLECQPPPVVPIPTPHITQHQPGLPSLMGAMPLPFIPPAATAPIIPQPSPVLVHNAALANVLANLNIPSTTIQPIVQPQQQQHQQQITNPFEETKTVVPQPHISPPVAPSVLVQPKQEPDVTESPYWNANIANATNPPVKDEPSNILHDPPEHLPPMQKELFLRIQQQQLKHENKVVKAESDEDERPDDDGWYSSDEDERENRGKSSGFKDSSSKAQGQNHSISQPQAQPTIDISSVISSIRQTVELPNINLNKRRNSPSPPSNHGDIDLRTTTSSGGQGQSTNNQSHGPFGDTDFRLPSHRPDLRDIDLRLTSSPPGPGPVPSVPSTASENARLSTNPLAFLKLPSGPATEIDASINSHPPVQYKLKIVLGVEAPDYRYIRHTMTPSQLLMDPRLGPRPGSGTLSLIPDPASPPSSSHGPPPVSSHHSPATIPAGDSLIMDPRVRRSAPGPHGQQQQQMHQPQMPLPPSQMPGLLGDPRFPRDPRTIQIGVPGGWPSAEDMNMSQAALAAQFMNVHQQMGIPPLFPNFPNAPGFPNPFMQPDFSGFNQGGPGPGPMGHHSRQQFQNNHGQGRGRPVSSWERYSQQQSDQDGSNIGTARGMTP